MFKFGRVAGPQDRYIRRVRVLVPAAGLRSVLGSRDRLEQQWSSGSTDVMVLLQTLQVTGPTLHEVLQSGFVTLDDPVGIERFGLRHRSALGLLEALAVDGSRVPAPKQNPRQVVAVAVHDVHVDGISALRRSA